MCSYAGLEPAPQMAWTVTDASFDAVQGIALDASLALPLFPCVPSDTFQTMPKSPSVTSVEIVMVYEVPGAYPVPGTSWVIAHFDPVFAVVS